ncbi:hypothetical protein Clacol_002600 [Clathrus columnatus]|uniref:Uncharacterized protein n=1 Tax=Clathrus columnatus TaxID=1419009 RepID=A0AAV5A2B1_9AGAM|nr:hypothetical protein Clacol_002600 [Clathrus columnatus]
MLSQTTSRGSGGIATDSKSGFLLPKYMAPSAQSRHPSSIDAIDDPLSFALRPPDGETEEERKQRLAKEALDKEQSNQIDEELRAERETLRRRKAAGEVKLLLLGQAESGKSTLQKQFQLMHCPVSLDQERSSWSTVVYLNIVKAIRAILDSFDKFPLDPATLDESSSTWPNRLANLKLRLSPLLGMEASLTSRFSVGGNKAISGGKEGVLVHRGWQTAIKSNPFSKNHSSWKSAPTDANTPPDDPVGRIICACKDDVKELWEHPSVKEQIRTRRLRLDDGTDFFLNDIDRIGSPGYLPSIDDIMRARIRTMGIAEHEFEVSMGSKAVRWLLYDVGGARSQRNSWIPYFDDATAIIFLAPISAFDQYLDEDSRTNRIDDSLQLFTKICSHRLLKHVHMVLFLNKTDLLKAKLESGILVKR